MVVWHFLILATGKIRSCSSLRIRGSLYSAKGGNGVRIAQKVQKKVCLLATYGFSLTRVRVFPNCSKKFEVE